MLPLHRWLNYRSALSICRFVYNFRGECTDREFLYFYSPILACSSPELRFYFIKCYPYPYLRTVKDYGLIGSSKSIFSIVSAVWPPKIYTTVRGKPRTFRTYHDRCPFWGFWWRITPFFVAGRTLTLALLSFISSRQVASSVSAHNWIVKGIGFSIFSTWKCKHQNRKK